MRTVGSGGYRTTLRFPGLQPFLWTQFLGAFNDNFLKIVVSLLAMDAIGPLTGPSYVVGALVLPFLLFSGYAGALADRLSKRSVLVTVKVFEIAVMFVAATGLITDRMDVLLAAIFLMGAHSTFFSPAKYGIVPELLPDAEMSRANGLLEMSTFAAIVLGTAFGGELFERWRGQPIVIVGAMMAIAVAGLVTSLGVPRVAPAKPHASISLNPLADVWRGTARLWPDRTLWMTMIGVSYFWFVGTLITTTLLPFGETALGVSHAEATRLYTPMAVGIAIGSLLAGRLSGSKVELGLVPIGSFGLGAVSLFLAGAPTYLTSAILLFVVGIFGGLFAVPLNALLQQRPAHDEKGLVLATNNFYNTIGMILAAVAPPFLAARLGLSVREILFAAGLLTLAATIYVLALVPDFFVRFTLWMLTHTIYRIKIVGSPHIPQRGPALIICNHVSMIDGALVGACVQRFVRFMIYGPIYRHPLLNPLFRRMHAIPVTAGNKEEVAKALDRARQELTAGHVVCIFVEGAVSRTGNLLPFRRGFQRILEGIDVPVVPVYLDRIWGSIFSFKDEKFIWKMPKRLPYPVTVAFGAALPATVTAQEARLAIMELGCEAMRQRRPAHHVLPAAFMRVAKRRWSRLAMADSTGQTLTYGRVLTGALLLGRAIVRRTPGEANIGLLLPASVGGALANVAVSMAGRVPVNLNFTIGPQALAAAIDQAGIKTIVTSQRFLAKASIAEMPGMVFLEDFKDTFGGFEKIVALLKARLVPAWWLARMAGSVAASSSLAAIIFSSGSTGIPKGVMLTHANILTNVDALAQIFPMTYTDCFIGVLPFFHSFGFTGTLWFPLLQGASVAYHPNPMDAKTVGELAATYRGSMLISTPTFCNGYVRRCTKEQFAHLKYAIVGAEKLREPLANAFREQFGVSLLEGYGCTEMAPVVAVNRPDVAHAREHQVGTKAGSVGHPIPGVAAKVVDRETGEGPIFGREGLLLVKGPNLMAGYLKQPERTAEVVKDGWYSTGDIVKMDDDGFIFITDRLSRFSKIGGEMVPHIRIEEAINAILGDSCSAVTSVPDEAKGERLVAFYVKPDVTPEAIWQHLSETDLPKLWLPKRENLVPIDAIPTLGTGKVDLRRLRELALEKTVTA